MQHRSSLILLAAVLLLSGCVREHTDGDTVVLTYRWWAMLWGFFVPLLMFGAIACRHTRTWVYGKWKPWWQFYGWDVREWSQAVGALVVIGIAYATIFDRLEVTPEYFRESSLSPLRGARQAAFRDIMRIDLPPEGDEDPRLKFFEKRKKKSPPALTISFKDGHKETYDGWLVRQVQSTIVGRARKAGAIVTNLPTELTSNRVGSDSPAPPPEAKSPPERSLGEKMLDEARARSKAPAGGSPTTTRVLVGPAASAAAEAAKANEPPSNDPFENAQPKFVPVDPNRKKKSL